MLSSVIIHVGNCRKISYNGNINFVLETSTINSSNESWFGTEKSYKNMALRVSNTQILTKNDPKY